MKHILKLLLGLSTIALLFQCSSDDISETNSNNNFANITVIAESENSIFQFNVDGNLGEYTSENLSGTLGLEGTDYSVEHSDGLVSFFWRNGSLLNTAQKNLENLSTLKLEPICVNGPQEFTISATASDRAIVNFIDYPVNNVRNFAIRAYYNSSQQCEYEAIGTDQVVGAKTISNNSLFYTVIRNSDSYGIIKRSIEDLSLQDEIFFDTDFKVTINNDQLLVFTRNDLLRIYDIETFELVETLNFSYNQLGFQLGFFETGFVGDEMFIDISYPQPNRFAQRPATINYRTNQLIKGTDDYISTLQNQLDALSLLLETDKYVFDMERQQLIFSAIDITNFGSGALIYTNFNGEMLKEIKLDHQPFLLIVQK